MENEETLIICIDNSAYMKYLDPHRYKLLIQCIRLYCQLQIESHPKIAIGILTMGCNNVDVMLQPASRSIKKIMDELFYERFGLAGPLKFVQGVMTSTMFFPIQCKRKRVALFTGGSYIDMGIKQAEYLGTELKSDGVVVDVFNFEVKGEYFECDKMELDAFVAAAVDDKTQHIAHISTEPTTTLDDIIHSASQFFKHATEDQISLAKEVKPVEMDYNSIIPLTYQVSLFEDDLQAQE